ncbi:aminoglycoside phosphotransferase family protein [Micromonospora sp. NBC_01813]|uniref:aminoglycoside phosphotransferase family protein n=1 Tax=Micromonospora sp. NBC_01813 TaxID=2975988 RepID=UPI002DD7FFF1|nr:aminoglycoside phosphotransferase family protein [Micromonospora sp. NBC_01813]WSA09456.1 aminoglycoside phosphotransferase family protein [Micromonospora sp. NBC_01813]
MDDRRWRDPEWLAQVRDWIDGRLDELGVQRNGPAVQPHVYPWSTVLRVPTDRGDVWFKANTDSLRHEAGVVQRIAARRPDVVPPLLAADTAAGWLLMADAGETLRVVTQREHSLDRWRDVLPLYAGVQLDLAGDVDDLLALGLPDRRLATLPDAYARIVDEVGAEQRFRDAVPMVAELCAELAEYGLPELLQHDDLHDAQVFVRDGRHLVLDWGDACVSHPFFTLSVTLEGGLAWGLDDVLDSVDTAPFRDAYLAPYAERFTGDLVAATRVALRLGWVCRAVNGQVPGYDKQTLTRLRMFLDGRP